MDFRNILSIIKAGVAGASGDKDGHEFRGNQWTVMGPWGQPVPRPRDPATNKPLKGAALDAELKRLYPSASTPIPVISKPGKTRVATPKSPSAPAPAPEVKTPKPFSPIANPNSSSGGTGTTTFMPTGNSNLSPLVSSTPNNTLEKPKVTETLEEDEEIKEPHAQVAETVYATDGEKPIALRLADAKKWKPQGELEEKAAASALAIAKRIYVPKERQALFVKNLTNILTNPEEFRKALSQANAVKVNDRVRANAALLKMCGFTGKPRFLSEAEFRAEKGKVAYSGLSNSGRSSQTLQQKLATLASGGFPRYGGPMFGAAFYTSTDKGTPATYATSSGSGLDSCIFRAKMIDPSNIYEAKGDGPLLKLDIIAADAYDHGKRGATNHPDYKMGEIMKEAGYTADEIKRIDHECFEGDNCCKSLTPALAGYDALRDQGHNYLMILNRGAMVMPDNYATKISGTNFGPEGAEDAANNVPIDLSQAVRVPGDSDDNPEDETIQKGDKPGHVFHGNQHSQGGGIHQIVSPLLNSEKEVEAVVSKLSAEMKLPPKLVLDAMLATRPFVASAIAEAKRVGSVITDSAKDSGGTRRRSLFAIKSLQSATEKTLKDCISHNQPQWDTTHELSTKQLEDTAAHIHDLLRYTVTWPEKNITNGVKEMISSLRAKGFVPLLDGRGRELIKNYFNKDPENGYRGINCNFVDPKTGNVIEVQFHTKQSLDTAEAVHKIYDKVRKAERGSPEYEEGRAQMMEGFSKIRIPEGLGEIGLHSIKKTIL